MASSRNSHRWYIAPGVKTVRFGDPVTRASIVELRSTGAQTLVGPSIHPTGEAYEMLNGQPTKIDADVLRKAVASLAEAVISARHGHTLSNTPGTTTSTQLGHQNVSDEQLLRRATAYLEKIPPAVSGQGGHGQTFVAATALVHGFGLSDSQAMDLLLNRYNPKCQPPWTEKELRHKIEDAKTRPHLKPFGWLAQSG